jgi:transposase-like protein
MKPGVSVARMAMQHAINANLLRTWITKAQSANAIAIQMAAPEVSAQAAQAFVPVKLETTLAANPQASKATRLASKPMTTLLRMQVCFPNGPKLRESSKKFLTIFDLRPLAPGSDNSERHRDQTMPGVVLEQLVLLTEVWHSDPLRQFLGQVRQQRLHFELDC